MSKNLIIVKSNNLIEASYKLTLDEMRILLLTIGKIDPELQNHHRDFEFTVAEFADRFGVDEKVAYQQVQTAVDKLGGRWAVLEDTPKVRRKAIFLTDQTYFKGEGRFQIVLHEKLMPFVSDIKRKFTKYNLEYVAKFNGFHSIRLYEILAQFRETGWREVALSNLKEWLQVSDKYDRYNNFNQRVLTPAIKEINEKSDLLINVEQIKRGRTIHVLKFVINQKKQEVKSAKNATKHNRPKLPQRPRVRVGSHEEGEYFRRCENTIREYWKGIYQGKKWFDIWTKLPTSELELLYKYYKAFGDDYNYKTIKKILDEKVLVNGN